jgi:acetyl-CoA carboxylase carboxyltransferase component
LSSTTLELNAPVHGSVIAIEVQPGQQVAAGTVLLLLEAMKMEVPLEAPCHGEVLSVQVAVGEVASDGEVLVRLRPLDHAPVQAAPAPAAAAAPAGPRADLQRLLDRRALLSDAARPEAMARRHATGLRSARENLADLLDAGSFIEYGGFAVAAQTRRRSLDDLQKNTPADGLVAGTGTVQGRPIAVLAYDYTVLAGTQGMNNHAKSDRVLDIAARQKLPLVWFMEGGGGRPGDVDWPGVAGLHISTFARWAALAGVVPRIGVVAGYCFAGNAALLGCCDIIVAVQGASIGMGGPAMIEGGGLGKVAPQDVGPLSVLSPNGVVDLVVADEAAACRPPRPACRC